MVPLIMSQMRAGDSAGIDTVWMVSSASYVFFATSYLAVSLFLSRSRGNLSAGCGRIFSYVYRGDGAQIYNLYMGAQGDLLAGALLSLAYAFVSFAFDQPWSRTVINLARTGGRE